MKDNHNSVHQATNAKSNDEEQEAIRQQVLSQEELHKRYIEQQRRMNCPGCGEGQEIY